uniref:Uncharacterized protein n=1 Tax=Mesocestoides corti TaxID=53468 RepID=A0A5K3ETU5_MESCO
MQLISTSQRAINIEKRISLLEVATRPLRSTGLRASYKFLHHESSRCDWRSDQEDRIDLKKVAFTHTEVHAQCEREAKGTGGHTGRQALDMLPSHSHFLATSRMN